MRKTILLMAGLAIVAVIAWWYSGKSAAPNENQKRETIESAKPARSVISVGVLAPLTGELKLYGENLERGARVAAAVINSQGGILGKELKLQVLDTRSSPSLTRELANELIQRAKVSLLIGTVSEEAALQAIDVATEHSTPFIYTGNGRVKTCRKNDLLKASEFVWGTGLTPQMKIEPFLI